MPTFKVSVKLVINSHKVNFKDHEQDIFDAQHSFNGINFSYEKQRKMKVFKIEDKLIHFYLSVENPDWKMFTLLSISPFSKYLYHDKKWINFVDAKGKLLTTNLFETISENNIFQSKCEDEIKKLFE